MAYTREKKTPLPFFDQGFLAKLEYLYLVSKKVFTGQVRAQRRSRKTGAGMEFTDHRPYVPGDDFRAVDWNLYGRMNRLLVKLFQEEEDLAVYLLVDCSRSMTQGRVSKFDYIRRVAAALAYVALANLDRVSLIPWADTTRPGLSPKRGKAQIFRILEWLTELDSSGETNLARSMHAFVHEHPHKGLTVVISDFFDPAGYEEGLKVLRHHGHETFAIQVCDVRDAYPEGVGQLRLVDVETGVERAGTVTEQVLREYRKAFREYCAALEGFCLSQQIGYIRTLTDAPFEDLVLRVFRQGKFLR